MSNADGHGDETGGGRDGGQAGHHARGDARARWVCLSGAIRMPAQLSAAAAAEKCVAAKALVASAPAFTALPALNPNQPTHSRPVPMRLSTTLCGGIGSCGKPDALAQHQRADQRRDARN